MKDLEIIVADLADLQPDPANPRTHDSRNLAAIKASLEEHGQVEPILVRKADNMVIAGNGRMTAMKQLGWKQATIAVIDVDLAQARKLSIALNRSGELAGWDEAVLTQHLKDLSATEVGWSPESLGFDETEVDALLASFADTPAPLPPEVEPENVEVVSDTDSVLPPGTSPTPMPSSTTKVVQLFLDEQTLGTFQMAVRHLAEDFGTDNVTDTVVHAVLKMASKGVE